MLPGKAEGIHYDLLSITEGVIINCNPDRDSYFGNLHREGDNIEPFNEGILVSTSGKVTSVTVKDGVFIPFKPELVKVQILCVGNRLNPNYQIVGSPLSNDG